MKAKVDNDPSPWIRRFSAAIRPAGQVLDLAAGSGRHARLLLGEGFQVTALDRDTGGLAPAPGLEIVAADLEDGSPWPLGDRRFAAIVVTNYLHRPLFGRLCAALEPGGLLLYETFQQGNELFGKPSNPDFLLALGELLRVAAAGQLTVLGYFSGYVPNPKPAIVQRLAARRGT